ncbi:type I 3-dehydroquinate dehydratase [Clostridiaceae bacterium]|nr:type I 3-dehydroquinate dehydratase [Clostridiaceae bacterium]RKI15574.1 type I 3-dehydroquinate dehydratase [bacterium 1XD21-70]
MKPVVVRNVAIGQGRPKVCVPIVAAAKEEILRAAENMEEIPADIVEWRADWYEDALQTEKVVQLAGFLREKLGEKPLLFTFRTAREGGEKALPAEEYEALNTAVVQSGYVDLLDVELLAGDEAVTRMLDEAHRRQVRVICSNHDFFKTPPKEEMLGRLRKMQQLGADILKLAVMPQSKRDVLALLEVTLEMSEEAVGYPVVTMSMASLGMVSRLVGEAFGSAISYGAVGQRSAPGQPGARELAEVLDMIHRNLE